VLSKSAGEVFHAVVDGNFTIVDVVIPAGWYAGSDNDAFGRQGIFPAAACSDVVDCHTEQLLYGYKAQMIKRILDGGHGRVALSDTLAGQRTSDGRLIVDSATLFLSHAWMMETGEFLDVTIANMDDDDYAWIDIFVYPQFSEGDGSTDAWIQRFDNMIVGIGKVVRLAAVPCLLSP
jgi:hypothetical protein